MALLSILSSVNAFNIGRVESEESLFFSIRRIFKWKTLCNPSRDVMALSETLSSSSLRSDLKAPSFEKLLWLKFKVSKHDNCSNPYILLLFILAIYHCYLLTCMHVPRRRFRLRSKCSKLLHFCKLWTCCKTFASNRKVFNDLMRSIMTGNVDIVLLLNNMTSNFVFLFQNNGL